jgi:hypothetical protein
MIMLFLGCGLGGSRRDTSNVNQRARSPRGFRKSGAGGPTAAGGAGGAGVDGVEGAAAGGGGRVGFWHRQRLRKGRSSFGENESQLRVKDEYA